MHENNTCPAVTFVEQVSGLTRRYARRTPPLNEQLASIGLALAGRAGARLAGTLGMRTSRSTLLRLLRALPIPAPAVVPVLGVDDFALRRGHHYGTVLINMVTHRPVDLLPDREADTFAAWLTTHPGAEVICRDRASAYAQAAGEAAPDAVQVADRWHLLHNLGEYVEKTVAGHLHCLRRDPAAQDDNPPEDNPSDHDPADDDASVREDGLPQGEEQGILAGVDDEGARATQPRREGKLVERTRQRYDQVQALLAQGKGVKTIVRELGLARGTVRRFTRASSVEELLAVALAGRPSVLDAHRDWIHQRWGEGVTNVMALFRQLQERGYTGSYGTLRDYVHDLADPDTPPGRTTRQVVPKARAVTGWILRRPESLTAEDEQGLEQARARCPELDSLADHVAAFATMLTTQHGELLDDWLATVEADKTQTYLHSFATGIRRDYAAVHAGLTLPYNSGVVEGNINRIKMIKRQMYGRAGFDLLRTRVLLAP